MPTEDWPSPQDPVSSAIYRLARAHRAHATTLLRDLGLHTGQEIVLLQLAERDPEPMTQGDLVAAMMLDHSTVAKSLRRMEAGELIERRPADADRRVVEVRLASRGRELVARIEEAWHAIEAATVGELDAQERDAAVALMRRMERSVVAAAGDVRGS